jgi:hypothetical protein
MSTATGSCLCGAVRYALNGDPITSVLCHCKYCKKASGSTFQANLFYKQEVTTPSSPVIISLKFRVQALVFTAGEDKLTRYLDRDTDSGGAPLRMFCSTCGSNVITTNEANEFVKGHVIVASGCLDGEVKFQPVQEFYCRNKSEWVGVFGETKKVEGMV